MSDAKVERRLVAILAADVAGYSRLMGEDEEGTRVRLRSFHRDLIDPLVTQHQGRIVKTMGDGMLVEYASVVEALRCAIALQSAMAEQQAGLNAEQRLTFRIGIHMGDVMQESGDIFGDGVNVAARIESLAEPGSVYLSEDAQRQVLGKLSVTLEDRGEQRLKNISRPIRVYRVRTQGGASSALPLPDKPAIAVLPFQNMSGDSEQDYFADGIVEEITTALARMRWLFVISRNSSFTYKGRAVDIKQVGRELGVRYVLEGSVRKAGNRIRITGQLIDATNGAHIWAERFEGGFEDIFELQDQVASKVAGALGARLEEAEIERAKRKPTESLDAYDYYLRGLAEMHRWTSDSNQQALALFRKAIDLDPGYASAYGMAARTFSYRKYGGWTKDAKREAAEALVLARKAAALGMNDASALSAAGMALAYAAGEVSEGSALIDRAVMLNPNLATAWVCSGWAQIWREDYDKAIEHLGLAMRLSPNDPLLFVMQMATCTAHYCAGRFDQALDWAEAALAAKPDVMTALWAAVACAARAGQQAAKEKALQRLRSMNPPTTIDEFRAAQTYGGINRFALWLVGLREAGLCD